MNTGAPYILMLEDDADDRHIAQTFFAANNFSMALEFVTNSDDVMPYLEDCARTSQSLPRLILLDKNVPAGGGMEVLKSLKTHPIFKIIPVVMISGTATRSDINESYDLGVNSFIVKPVTAEQTEKTIQSFLKYWFFSVELPTVPISILSGI